MDNFIFIVNSVVKFLFSSVNWIFPLIFELNIIKKLKVMPEKYQMGRIALSKDGRRISTSSQWAENQSKMKKTNLSQSVHSDGGVEPLQQIPAHTPTQLSIMMFPPSFLTASSSSSTPNRCEQEY